MYSKTKPDAKYTVYDAIHAKENSDTAMHFNHSRQCSAVNALAISSWHSAASKNPKQGRKKLSLESLCNEENGVPAKIRSEHNTQRSRSILRQINILYSLVYVMHATLWRSTHPFHRLELTVWVTLTSNPRRLPPGGHQLKFGLCRYSPLYR